MPLIAVALFVLIYSYVVYKKVNKIGESAGGLKGASGNGTWDSVKAGYLRQVEKALASAGHREKKQVLEDVQSHLDQRFSELGADEQTWENMQAIITEMGPASDYAELLVPETPAGRQASGRKSLTGIVISAVVAVIVTVIVLVTVLSNKQEAYKLREVGDVESLGHPFENDPEVIGYWKSVDFVEVVEDFGPETKAWKGDLFLKDFRFKPNGRTSLPWTWTKDWIWHNNGRTKAQYKIKWMGGETYLLLPWLSGDVTIRGQKPCYYVLKKVPGEQSKSVSTEIDRDDQVATDAVDSAKSWLGLIDEGDYGASWEDAADIFKNAASKEQWEGMAKTVRQPLGKVISRLVMSKMATQTMPGGPDGEYVIIQFKTSFENKADTIETVTPMLDKDGVWRVSGYYIK